MQANLGCGLAGWRYNPREALKVEHGYDMNLLVTRPPVGDVSLHLFSRSIHPELYETLARREVTRDDYLLTVSITPTGHALYWRTPELHLVEIMSAREVSLPARGRVWRHRFAGERRDAFRASATISYQASWQAEVLPPKVFRRVQDELIADGRSRGLLHIFESNAVLSPLGFVTADARSGCLVVNAFHTFPEERAILKTQTLIERAEG